MIKAWDILEVLRLWHSPNGKEWAFFGELRVGTGYRIMKDMRAGRIDPQQRLDAWAINLYPSQNMLRRTFEIKVSRSDFLHEIKHPQKRQAGLLLSNEFYFATPEGLVRPEEIPVECGLLWISLETGNIKTVKKAPYREADGMPMGFMASLARRAAEYETRMKELIQYDKSRNIN